MHSVTPVGLSGAVLHELVKKREGQREHKSGCPNLNNIRDEINWSVLFSAVLYSLKVRLEPIHSITSC